MELSQIKNKADLKQISDFLKSEGFGSIDIDILMTNKILHIIAKNNEFNVTYDKTLPEKLKSIGDFDQITKSVEQYFSKFNVNDKIDEFIEQDFRILEDDTCSTPFISSDINSIIKWVNFKLKYNLSDVFGTGNNVSYYDLDKKYLRIHFGEYRGWKFERLYNLLFGEDCSKFDEKNKMNEWQNIGKIEIKFFKNKSMYIKGDITKLKEHYYKYLVKRDWANTVFKYNNKTTVNGKRGND